MNNILVLIIITFLCSGCFRRWVMTDKQIETYYQHKSSRPSFFHVTNDSVDLYCAVTGADTLPAILMIHGAPGAWYGSRNLLEDTILQKHFQIIAVDRPGYNKSTYKGRRRPVPSITIQAKAIHQAMQLNRSGKTAVVMGSSYGAPIAAKIAILHPENYHHLLMLAPAIDPEQEKFWWFHKYLNSGLLIHLLPKYIRAATAEKFAHASELDRMLPEWKRLNIPVTVIQGGADRIVAPGNLEFARQQLRGKKAGLIYLPQTGHLIRYSNTALVRDILINSLPDLRPTK